jgi:hypothetical protein
MRDARRPRLSLRGRAGIPRIDWLTPCRRRGLPQAIASPCLTGATVAPKTMSSARLIRSLAAERDALRATTQQQMERLQRAERKLRELEARHQREALEQVQAESRKVGGRAPGAGAAGCSCHCGPQCAAHACHTTCPPVQL